MFRAKVLLFMIPLVLPIGQPPAEAVDTTGPEIVECVASPLESLEGVGLADPAE
ncbi:MAG: hypothetical protein AAFX76_11405 [Planctomycetota bacterium]